MMSFPGPGTWGILKTLSVSKLAKERRRRVRRIPLGNGFRRRVANTRLQRAVPIRLLGSSP